MEFSLPLNIVCLFVCLIYYCLLDDDDDNGDNHNFYLPLINIWEE